MVGETKMAEITDNDEQMLYKESDIRKNKIKQLKAMGINPFAPKFETTHSILKARELKEGDQVTIAGRMVFRRTFGKFMFVQISDIYARIQVSLSVNEINAETYKFFNDYIDLGDFVGFTGVLYRTKTGELTVQAHSYKLLSKASLPLPEKYHGLTDIDLRYRQRYLDLVSNDETKKVFLTRSKVINFIRNYLADNDFLEVETPVLQSVASGAAARPFVTKHNALDKTLYLRIAPELYLKQVVAGGVPRVYEIGKNYRNEGMDAQHLQEFTMLEWYASFWDYNDNINFITALIKALVKEVKGEEKLTYQGVELNFSGEWAKVDYIAKLNEVLQTDILTYDDVEELKAHILKLRLFDKADLADLVSLGAVFDFVYKRKIRPGIIQPTIVYNYPNLVPLARPSDSNKKVIEMFQVLVVGTELVKAYSELVDPQVQREGFEEQMKNKEKGDEEAFTLDEDFLLAMEHGMPPMSGLGLGIDRLITILTDQETLRDVVLFPTMK
jgi:lysyl-tRNA synthetase class 2